MTMHSRSDLVAVTLSPAHGGCGQIHSRPVDKGAPVKLWSLTCEPCENTLKAIKDPHWSTTLAGIPETPDEKEYREDQETKGRTDQQNQTAEALAKLASLGDLPAAIARLADMYSGESRRGELTPVEKCRACNMLLPHDSKFCPECGQKFTPEPPASRLPSLSDLTDDQLRALALEKGLRPHHKAGRVKLTEMLQGV